MKIKRCYRADYWNRQLTGFIVLCSLNSALVFRLCLKLAG